MSNPVESSSPEAAIDDSAQIARAARRDSRRRTTIVTVSMLATVAVIGLTWSVWPTGTSTTASTQAADQPVVSTPIPTAAAAARPSAAPSASPVPDLLPPAAATTHVADFLAAAAAIAPDATDTSDRLSKVASGAIIAEIENDQQELVANGWTQEGTPTVVSLTIVSADATAIPPTTVAEACIDSSDVVTLDSDGKSLAGAGNDQTHRALNIFTLQQSGSTWRVISRTFPADTTC
ncbi:hypothetical protein AB4Y63_15620 [Leifsonia sp. YAF41]|uniref:hypothetical protein n=1 Tax=Leifsonia sp. YAF41 TaxID=3233086 RepID=UPI003F9BD853